MKTNYYIAQTSVVIEPTPPQPIRPVVVSVEVFFGLLAGSIGALGLPKLFQLFATEKIKNVESERRREDSVYTTLFNSLESMMKSMTEMNKTMSASQTVAASESFHLMTSLVEEISKIREVVVNNTEVMKQVSATNGALTEEIHEMRLAGAKLRDEMEELKTQVIEYTKKCDI